jgi:hypothetical protein
MVALFAGFNREVLTGLFSGVAAGVFVGIILTVISSKFESPDDNSEEEYIDPVVETYTALSEVGLRRILLRRIPLDRRRRLNSAWGRSELIKVGLADADGECRRLAHERADFGDQWFAVGSSRDLKRILAGDDAFAAAGLACNRSLDPHVRNTGRQRLTRLAAQVAYSDTAPYRALREALTKAEHFGQRLDHRRLSIYGNQFRNGRWTPQRRITFIGDLVGYLPALAVLVQACWLSAGAGLVLGAAAFVVFGSLAGFVIVGSGTIWIGCAFAYWWLGRRHFNAPWAEQSPT